MICSVCCGAREETSPRCGFSHFGSSHDEAEVKITPIQKVSLISRARPLVPTAPPSTRGACLMAADQAPRRARSMRARGKRHFNGVAQTRHQNITPHRDNRHMAHKITYLSGKITYLSDHHRHLLDRSCEVVDVLDIAHGCGLPYVGALQGCADPGKCCVADTRSYCYLFMVSIQGFKPSRPPI